MDGLDMLKEDHKKVAALFKKVEKTDSPAEKLKIFEQIKGELELHTQIEEKILYPTCEEYDELKDMVLESYEEHKQVKTLLREISALSKDSEKLEAKLTVLRENVEHHVEEEETDFFPKIPSAMDEDEYDEMSEDIVKAKQGELTLQ